MRTCLFVFSSHVTRAGRAMSLTGVPMSRARIHIELGNVDAAQAGVPASYGTRSASEFGQHEALLGPHDALF